MVGSPSSRPLPAAGGGVPAGDEIARAAARGLARYDDSAPEPCAETIDALPVDILRGSSSFAHRAV